MDVSSQLRMYGQLVIDFANAKMPEEANLKYQSNIDCIFGKLSIYQMVIKLLKNNPRR
jgi:hypothetical protein